LSGESSQLPTRSRADNRSKLELSDKEKQELTKHLKEKGFASFFKQEGGDLNEAKLRRSITRSFLEILRADTTDDIRTPWEKSDPEHQNALTAYMGYLIASDRDAVNYYWTREMREAVKKAVS
jgi:hypothetical protein